MLLEPDLLSRIERLALISRHRVAGMYPGEHRSRSYGTSVDFADWREYVPGDDFRRIDHQIYGRLDKLLIRLYEAEDELALRIVLDGSASMGFNGKFDFAKRLAGALCYLAACRRDRARVWFSGGEAVAPGPWSRSRDSALAAMSWIESLQAGGINDLTAQLRFLASAGNTRGMNVLITDLMTEDWEAVIRSIGGPGTDRVVLHVVSEEERDPPARGDLMLVDSETRSTLDVSISDQVLGRYKQRVSQWLSQTASTCRRNGIGYVLVDPSMSLDDVVLRHLRSEGVVR